MESLRRRLGGPARTRAIVLFACVLGLDTADLASLGAVAGQLKPALGLSYTQLGVLAAAPSLVAAATTLPFGVLADRTRRVPVLAASVCVWAVAMVLSGTAASFEELLFFRVFLGAAAAASAPMVASLVGDLFWPGERGRVYGWVLSGQLLGSGFGLLVSGNLAGVSWRAGLWVLALPSIAVAYALWRMLPEPARGGASRLPRGATHIPSVEEVESGEHDGEHNGEPLSGQQPSAGPRDPAVKRAVKRAQVAPREELVLERDPARMTIWQAVRYVLSIPTNVRLIVASALGYFFQAGVNTFGVVYVIARFGTSQSAATLLLGVIALGALAGTVMGGRIADRLLHRGHVGARMMVGGVGFVACSLVFVPGLLSANLGPAVLLFIVAAMLLAAPNAPLDAARLDVVPGRLWGRAESIRTVLRTLAMASAPLLFGFVSDELATGGRTATKSFGYQASGPGLKYTFLLMLIPMAIGGVLLLRGRHAYPRDVATALASEERMGGDGGDSDDSLSAVPDAA